MLSELVDKYEYFEDCRVSFEGEEGDWFFLKADDVQARTCLTEKEQRHAIEVLEKLGFVKKILKGLPATRYFQIFPDKIFEYLNSNKKYQFGEKPNLIGEKPNKIGKKAKLDSPKSQTDTGKDTPHPYIQKEQIQREQTIKSASLSEMNACSINANLKSKMQSLDVELEDSEGKFIRLDQATKEAIIRTSSEEEIEGALNYLAESYYAKGIKPKNPVGAFRQALKQGWTGRTDEERECLAYVERMKSERGIESIQIYQTHIVDTETSKDLSFKGMSLGDFKRRFNDTFLNAMDAPKFTGV